MWSTGGENDNPLQCSRESQGRGSLVGCHLWGRTESDTTEATQQQQHADDGPLMAESEEELKEPLDESERGE